MPRFPKDFDPDITEASVSAALTAAKRRISTHPAARANPAQGGSAPGADLNAVPSHSPGGVADAPPPSGDPSVPARAEVPTSPSAEHPSPRVRGIRHAPGAPLPEDPVPILQRMANHYGWDGPIPEHVIAALELDLPPIDCVRRAIDRMFMFLLGKWARGEIDGPDTHDNLQEQAKQADKLARMFDKKGKPEQAEKQRARAEELRHRPVAQSEDWFAKVRQA